MSWASVPAARLRGLFEHKRLERELDDEVRFHLEMQIEDNRKAGNEFGRRVGYDRRLSRSGFARRARSPWPNSHRRRKRILNRPSSQYRPPFPTRFDLGHSSRSLRQRT